MCFIKLYINTGSYTKTANTLCRNRYSKLCTIFHLQRRIGLTPLPVQPRIHDHQGHLRASPNNTEESKFNVFQSDSHFDTSKINDQNTRCLAGKTTICTVASAALESVSTVQKLEPMHSPTEYIRNPFLIPDVAQTTQAILNNPMATLILRLENPERTQLAPGSFQLSSQTSAASSKYTFPGPCKSEESIRYAFGRCTDPSLALTPVLAKAMLSLGTLPVGTEREQTKHQDREWNSRSEFSNQSSAPKRVLPSIADIIAINHMNLDSPWARRN